MVTTGEFRRRSASRGIELRLHPTGSIQVPVGALFQVLGLAEELGLVVLGMEGLREDGAVVVPLDDFIADLSDTTGTWSERVHASAAAARAIGAEWGTQPDLVELILDGLGE